MTLSIYMKKQFLILQFKAVSIGISWCLYNIEGVISWFYHKLGGLSLSQALRKLGPNSCDILEVIFMNQYWFRGLV